MSESFGDPRQHDAGQAETAPEAPEMEPAEPDLPKSLTFRITPVTLLVVIVLAVCMTPVAWAQTWLLSIYLIPLVLFVWVLRARTVVDRDVISARTVRTTRIPWDDVQSFRLEQRRWLRAVLRKEVAAGRGREVLLPAVRVRDLPRLAAMSGGRLPDFDAATQRDEKNSDPPAATGDSGD